MVDKIDVYKSKGPAGRYYFSSNGKSVPGQLMRAKEGTGYVANPEFSKTLAAKYRVVDKEKKALNTSAPSIETLSIASARHNKVDIVKLWAAKGITIAPSAANQLWKLAAGDINKINAYIEKSFEANTGSNCLLYGATMGFYVTTKSNPNV